jgi:HlyD family secretion protein
MKTCHWRASMVALLLGAGLLALPIEDAGKNGYPGFLSPAHAQPLRKLIARLRGQTLPDGIAKAEGRIEATQADVSSKYPGQLAEISVEEGTKVAIGQAIGRVSSPEFEAQLRAAQSDLQSAQDGLAGAESEIASRRRALEFAKSDFERGQALMKSGFITKQAFEERQRNYGSAEAAVLNMTSRRDQADGRHKGCGGQSPANRGDDPRSRSQVPQERTGSVSVGAKRGDRRGRRTDRDDS